MKAKRNGFLLLSRVLSLPVVVMFCIALVTSFFFATQKYFALLGDWEVHRQVQFVAERLFYDLSIAEELKDNFGSYEIYQAYQKNGNFSRQYVYYDYSQREINPRIHRNSQPLTGETIIGTIAMTEFSLKKISPNVVQFSITGENRKTQHKFSIQSAVRLKK